MRIPLIIAAAAIREHSRRKLILVFSIISFLVTGVVIYFTRDASAEAVFGPQAAAGFAALGFFGLFALIIALAVSMGTVGQPFASGEALSVLVRPVARWQFVVGRFLGSASTIVGLCLLMALETQLIQYIAVQELEADLWGHWGVTAFNLLVVAAVTTLASVFFAVPALAAVIGFLVNQFSGASRILHALADSGEVKGTAAQIFRWVWYLTPKYLISPLEATQAQATTGEDVAGLLMDNTPGLAVWASAWIVGLILLSAVLTGRKKL